MHRKLALTAVLAVALAVTGYAQKKDFSGTWTLDTEASAAANASTTTTPPAGGGGGGGGMRGGGAGPITIKQTADSLSIERQGRGGTPTTTTYKLDGSEQEITMGPATVKAKAKWDGDKIAVEVTRAGQDGTPVTTWTIYALDDKGQLWVENKSPNGSRKSVYKKTT